jgi:hypothetical protein
MRKPRVRPPIRVVDSLHQVRGGGHVDNPGQTALKDHVENPSNTPMKD